jgi:ubiquinone/menaquinone biosynthesis C-methylase UbiE
MRRGRAGRKSNDSRRAVPRELLNHYRSYDEARRLMAGSGLLEKARTRELLSRHLPPPPATILDVGGGTGVHAFWLAGQGYEVHLIDPVRRHVAEARRGTKRPGVAPLASIRVGEARALPVADESCDGVLLLGPLYHLTDRRSRLKALKEARRVLRPGGWLFAAAICRFASILDGLYHGFIDDPDFMEILRRDLKSGQHRNPGGQTQYFTTAFFHRPEELKGEVVAAGLQLRECVAVEGPAWIARGLEGRWANPDRWSHLLKLVRLVESEPALMGASPHLLAVARKRRSRGVRSRPRRTANR